MRFTQISLEFDRITGLNGSMENFVHKWKSTWIKAILCVSMISSIDYPDSMFSRFL